MKKKQLKIICTNLKLNLHEITEFTEFICAVLKLLFNTFLYIYVCLIFHVHLLQLFLFFSCIWCIEYLQLILSDNIREIIFFCM